MKHLLSILLLTVITFAAPVSQIFRFRIVNTEENTEPQVGYLGLKGGVAVITKDPSQAVKTYLDPDPSGMLYTDNKIPGYLLPTPNATVYDFRFGGIPKIAGVMYTEFTCIDLLCPSCGPKKDKILAYSPPKEGRYEGQFRSYNVSEDRVIKFHTSKPPPGAESVSILLVQEMV